MSNRLSSLAQISLALISLSLRLTGPALAQPQQTPHAAGEEFFEAKIRPLLLKHCGACHGVAQQSGRLRLDTHDGFLRGGTHGALINPNKPAESLLIQALTYENPKLKMPPAGKLADRDIALLTAWVQRGAPWTKEARGRRPEAKGTPTPPSASQWWSFQPIRQPAVPLIPSTSFSNRPRAPHSRKERKGRIGYAPLQSPTRSPFPQHEKGTGGKGNPIDAFILAKLKEKGMRPAPRASKRELIRRAAFDLLGLPPTPEEVTAFLQDPSPAAYPRLIDRLLASPRYGERWARYWLDLVRYADSNGYERDAEKPYSWKYRDYVIRAFNEDKPYNRFILEQLAGDELPDRNESTLTATGFLRLGTWDDEPNDALEYKYERLDDLVHTTSAAFLGLTVRCARCHDHKYDPIPQKDYYAMAGAFFNGFIEPGDGKFLGGPPPEKLGYPVLGFTDRGRDAPPLHLLINGDPRREAEVVPPGFLSALPQGNRPVTAPPPAANTTLRRLQLAEWIVDPRNPLTARVLVNRVWGHHFGRALVSTPNNFGLKGALPSHPELLDWLAAAFAGVGKDQKPPAEGKSKVPTPTPAPRHPTPYSLKSLHKLIMLSETYQMASIHPSQTEYARKDSQNVFLWKFNRRRLDADAMRDSMLAVSGQLNPLMGGRGFVPSVTREALEGLSKKGAEWNPSTPEEQRRRSIYLFLKRALIPPLMTVFDFGDTTAPLEQRDVTTVAPQALTLLNNAFVTDLSEAFARRLQQETGSSRERQIGRAWQLAFGRPPTPKEHDTALAFLKIPIMASPTPDTRLSSSPLPLDAGLRPFSGLRLWLRADRGVGVDEAEHVQRWEDQSGNGFHFQQMTSGAQPEFVKNAWKGHPALRFDGKGKFLTFPQAVLTGQEFSVVAIVNDREKAGGHREIFSNWNGAAGNAGTAVFLGTTGAGMVRFTDSFAPAGVLSKPEDIHLLMSIAGQEGAIVYQNRQELARIASALPPRNLNPPYVIGQQGNIQGEFWNGDILELMVFDHALTPVEREQVWKDVQVRYGLAPAPKPADQALVSLCHVLLNANEFLYVD